MVGFLIVFAHGVADRKPVQFCDQLLGARMQVLQYRIFDLVNTLNLPDQQLRIADQLQRLGPMRNRVFQSRNESLIFREVVGLVAQIFAECRDSAARFILDDDSIPSGCWIAPSAAVDMCDKITLRLMLACVGKSC